jgi:glycosyltransferase involved in cell wall biosynthesis
MLVFVVPLEAMANRKILHIMQTSNLGGTEHAAVAAMLELQKVGARFLIASPRRAGLAWPKLAAIDPDARAFPCRDSGYLGTFDLSAFQALRQYVRDVAKGCDAIWISGSSVTSLLASRSISRPRLMSHHVQHFDRRLSWAKWKAFYEFLCHDLDAITYPTELVRKEAVRIAPWLQSRAHVVPLAYRSHYIDEQNRITLQREARLLLDLPQQALIIGNAGRIIKEKRYDVFLKTAALVHRRNPEACFVICGGGPAEQQMKKLAASLGIAPRVRFTGWIPNMQPYYQAWDIVLFNSDSDALPRTPMEAACHGAIIVASVLYGGLGEFVTHGRNGYLLDKHDPAELAWLVLQIGQDPNQAAMMRNEALLELSRRYSIELGVAFYKEFFGL